ncbi:MAG: 50S ribosomal protein L3 [Deltaproteobacteria bacterium]|nr:50S ribosomal protein L3 [Deltaproteobacteria bacterium]
MRLGILGKKVGMTQIFDGQGAVVPVTVVDTTGCVITQVKRKEKDGYSALQVAFGERKPQNVNKARTGHFKKAQVAPKAALREIRVQVDEEIAHVKPGQKLLATMFAKGDRVDVIGVTKGKGFQGVVKRHGFHGADASHGVHEYFRHGGSAGTNTFPGRILKNKGMPGQTGNVPRTTQNVEVAEVKENENLILLRGAIPGPNNGMVVIRSTKKAPFPEGRTWAE